MILRNPGLHVVFVHQHIPGHLAIHSLQALKVGNECVLNVFRLRIFCTLLAKFC